MSQSFILFTPFFFFYFLLSVFHFIQYTLFLYSSPVSFFSPSSYFFLLLSQSLFSFSPLVFFVFLCFVSNCSVNRTLNLLRTFRSLGIRTSAIITINLSPSHGSGPINRWSASGCSYSAMWRHYPSHVIVLCPYDWIQGPPCRRIRLTPTITPHPLILLTSLLIIWRHSYPAFFSRLYLLYFILLYSMILTILLTSYYHLLTSFPYSITHLFLFDFIQLSIIHPLFSTHHHLLFYSSVQFS